jgi:hypothetical protein
MKDRGLIIALLAIALFLAEIKTIKVASLRS